MKRGADRGVSGRFYFHDDKSGKSKQIVLSVKAGENLNVSHVRDLDMTYKGLQRLSLRPLRPLPCHSKRRAKSRAHDMCLVKDSKKLSSTKGSLGSQGWRKHCEG